MPKSFSKQMKAYHFLSKHPKFLVKFPRDGSKPSPEHPNSIRKKNLPMFEVAINADDPNCFVRHPTRSDKPACWEHSSELMQSTSLSTK
jgi:hypothetical protein